MIKTRAQAHDDLKWDTLKSYTTRAAATRFSIWRPSRRRTEIRLTDSMYQDRPVIKSHHQPPWGLVFHFNPYMSTVPSAVQQISDPENMTNSTEGIARWRMMYWGKFENQSRAIWAGRPNPRVMTIHEPKRGRIDRSALWLCAKGLH